jgi:hypothetical protein
MVAMSRSDFVPSTTGLPARRARSRLGDLWDMAWAPSADS